MDVYTFWSRHTAGASGTARKRVTCEECGTEYGYVLEREALGHSWSLYGLGLEGAQRKAEERAQRKLAGKLARGQEVVPCPKCGWIQADMVRIARRGHRRWVDTLGWFIVLLAVAAACLNSATGTGSRPRRVLVPWPALVSIAAAGAALVGVRHALASAHDPNAEPIEERLAISRTRVLEEPGQREDATGEVPPP